MLVGVAFLPPSFLPSGTQAFYIINRPNCLNICNTVQTRETRDQALGWGIRANLIFSNLESDCMVIFLFSIIIQWVVRLKQRKIYYPNDIFMQLESCRSSEFCHSMLQWSKVRCLWLYHMPCFVLTMLTSFSFATGRKKTIPLQTLGGFIYTFSLSFSSSFTCQSSRSTCSSVYSQNGNSNDRMSSVQLSFCCMYLKRGIIPVSQNWQTKGNNKRCR